MIKSTLFVFLLFVIVACQRMAPAEQMTAVPTLLPTSSPTATNIDIPAPTEISPTDPTALPTAVSTAENDPILIEPTIEVETAVDSRSPFPAASQTNGVVVILSGHVLDVNGNPLPDVAVEIWQTDVNGRYDHPGDPTSGQRDMNFQFYGTSITDAAGTYQFRTIIPGAYGNRPPHIHFKVKQNDTELLTSQFYFVEDITIVENEGLFTQAGANGHMLLLQAEPDANGELLIAAKDIVVDNGTGNGTFALTPAQTEGPYYPVVDVAAFDNDLIVLP